MIFMLWNPRARCAHRRAGRVLSRIAGLDCVAIPELVDAMGLVWRFP